MSNLITPRVQMEFVANLVSAMFDMGVMLKDFTQKDKINLLAGSLIGASAVGVVSGIKN
jgi:hypothetical protein